MLIRFVLCLITFHFSPNLLTAQQAEPVKRITQAQRSGAYYTQQVKAWGDILETEPKNGNAWYQYYTAARYSNIFNEGKKIDLDKIVASVVENIPNSYEAYYLTFALKPWESASLEYLIKAYNIDPENPMTYQAFIIQYLILEEKNQFKEFCVKHYQSVEHSPSWMHWNYNVLVNLEPNAILITEGDNDTYPAWALQEVKGFRTDVTIINNNLMVNEDYRAMAFRQLGIPLPQVTLKDDGVEAFKVVNIQQIIDKGNRPVYIGITSPLIHNKEFKENLHLVGLSLKYDKNPLENITVLKESYENLFQLDYLKIAMQEDPSQETNDLFSRTYLPSLFKLYEHLQESRESASIEKLEVIINIIGNKSKSQGEIQKVLAKYK